MEEDIKILEEWIEDTNKAWKKNDWFEEISVPKEKVALENLIKGYRELEEENAELKEESCCMTTCMRKDKEKLFLENKIKEKIEELNKRIEQYDEYSKQRIETDVEFYENIADTAIVQVLQELMEDK